MASGVAAAKAGSDIGRDWFDSSFGDPNGELWRTYDGLGHGQFVCAEGDVTRPPPVEASHYDISMGDAEEEGHDDAVMGEVDAVGDASGPVPSDTPYLRAPANGMPPRAAYCHSCHQDVEVVRYNQCPECDCTDSTVLLSDPLAMQCRVAPVINKRVITGIARRHPVALKMLERINARMKEEPGEVYTRPPSRLVGLGDPENRYLQRDVHCPRRRRSGHGHGTGG